MLLLVSHAVTGGNKLIFFFGLLRGIPNVLQNAAIDVADINNGVTVLDSDSLLHGLHLAILQLNGRATKMIGGELAQSTIIDYTEQGPGPIQCRRVARESS